MTPHVRPIASFALILLAGSQTAGLADSPEPGTAVEFFEKRVRPILVANCYGCHSADTNSKGGLRVDDRNGLIVGGSSGPAVVPGDPENSLLIAAVRYTNEDVKMPPKKRLSAEQVADLTRWVKDGAAWPEAKLAVSPNKANLKYEALKKGHWAWQPLRDVTPPQVRDASWPSEEIDRFVLAKLEEKGLKPVGDADRTTLLRRLSFDLTGLPPSPEAVDAFLADGSADAYDRVVYRLLASPAFGERWGRHWLDVARYGESTGSARNLPYPHAWRYRDYVIDAINKDKPYDRFIREQIAGDLLPAASDRETREQAIATGFLALGVKDVNQRFKVRYIMDNIDEQIDAVSRSVLGLTASCARCHDHKFDPIPQADYYALAGIFHSSDLLAGLRNKMGGGGLDYYDAAMLRDLGTDPNATNKAKSVSKPVAAEKIAKLNTDIVKAKAEFETLRGKPEGTEPGPDGRPKRAIAREKLTRLQQELLVLTDPVANGHAIGMGVRDAKAIADTEIRIRGEAEKLGPRVPRGFLSVVNFPGQPTVNSQQSGRLELAQWLTDPRNPLTPRVMANRVWQHLFGEGLVRSVDNFGSTGDVPSHPELLDHLASRFVRDGWSVKSLVRAIVTSRAYRLDSEATPANLAVDPGNRLVWRHAPRRLDAEEIRDATLAAAGSLDLAPPAKSIARRLEVRELPNNGPIAKQVAGETLASRHRSVYLPLLRGLTPPSLDVFDFASQGMVTGSRDTTTVATQALYLLNDPFVRREALSLARRVLQANQDDDTRIHLAYRLTLGREPGSHEFGRAIAYLGEYESAAREELASRAGEVEAGDKAEAGEVILATASARKPLVAQDQNPDTVDRVEKPIKEETGPTLDPKTAAWASFCQAILGSAEFRYVR